jgi:hypothetical protein
MAVTVVGTPTALDYTAGDQTIAYTVNASAELLVLGAVVVGGAGQISGITVGGNALTQLDTINNGSLVDVALWYRKSPPTGSQGIAVDFLSGTPTSQIGAITFAGVDLTNTFGTVVKGTTDNATARTEDVTAAVNDLVLDVVGAYHAAASTYTVGAGQTSRWAAALSGSTTRNGMGSTEAGATTVTMSWSSSTATYWGQIGVAVKAAAAAPATSSYNMTLTGVSG